MLSLYKKINDFIRNSYHVTMLGINIISLVLGVLYVLINKNNQIWNVYGIIMLVAFLGNIRLAAIEDKHKKLGYFYLILSFVGMFIILVINTLVSIIPTNQKSQSIISLVIIFLLFIIGGILAAFHVFHKQKELHITERSEKKRLIEINIRMITIILLSLALISGLFIVFMLLREQNNGIYEVFISQYALFYAISFLSIGVLIRKLLGLDKHFIYNTIILTITILVFMVCMLPFVATPLLLKNAETSFSEAFGDEYKTNPIYKTKHFRQEPFFLPEYFYGTPSSNYKLHENILFYEGKDGVDQGIKLYFDVYTPTRDVTELPGGNSVLIRIHGGGWTAGDKGMYNFSQMNKYFAEQGYVVFDIQYGLCSKEPISELVPITKSRVGNFTIDDLVRHIGIFTNYLSDHSDEYHANLDSVFISGGSAGGHLAIALGLGLTSGNYRDIFDERIMVKGIIPFYPGNGLSIYLGIEGRKEFVDPYNLVDENSPPCLIYQGSHDGLVPSVVAERFRKAYTINKNGKCAIITMPFGSHASDLYFTSYYNQVFLYYMERFMYQYK